MKREVVLGKAEEKSKRPLPCLTQGKNNSSFFRIGAGIVCQGKYLGGAFKMVDLFLYETVMRRLLNGCLGK